MPTSLMNKNRQDSFRDFTGGYQPLSVHWRRYALLLDDLAYLIEMLHPVIVTSPPQ